MQSGNSDSFVVWSLSAKHTQVYMAWRLMNASQSQTGCELECTPYPPQRVASGAVLENIERICYGVELL